MRDFAQRLAALGGLGALAMTAPLFPLAPALSPLIWLGSSMFRRASDVGQGLYGSAALARMGVPKRAIFSFLGGALAGRELARAALEERLLRFRPRF